MPDNKCPCTPCPSCARCIDECRCGYDPDDDSEIDSDYVDPSDNMCFNCSGQLPDCYCGDEDEDDDEENADETRLVPFVPA
jgi:hypothetical protein